MATRFCTTVTRSTPTPRTVTPVMLMGKASAESGSPRHPTWRRRQRPASLRLATSPDWQHLQRIDRAVIDAHLEVGMRSGRVAGRTDQADQLPALDLVAFLDADCQK